MNHLSRAIVRLFFLVTIPVLLLGCRNRQTGKLSPEDYAKADEIAEKLDGYLAFGKGESIKVLAPQVLPALAQASASKPGNTNYHFALYLCHAFTGNNKEALKEIERTYIVSSQDERYVASYVVALKMDWQPVKARDVMATHLKNHGGGLKIETFLAVLNLSIQEYEKARVIFEKWLRESGVENSKERTTILGHLGVCQLYLGQPQDAIASFEKAVKIYPENVLARQRWFSALICRGAPAEALAFCERELKGHEDSVRVLYYKGLALELMGKSQEAKEVYETALFTGEQDLKSGDDNGEQHFVLFEICTKLSLEQKAKLYRENAAKLHFTFGPPLRTNSTNNKGIPK